MTRLLGLLALCLALLCGLLATTWTLGRSYERGQLALLYQALEESVRVQAATGMLWDAVERDMRVCHDRLMRLTVQRPPHR